MLALRAPGGVLLVLDAGGTAAGRFADVDLAGGWAEHGGSRLIQLGGGGRAVDGLLSPDRGTFRGVHVGARVEWLDLPLEPAGEVPPALAAAALFGVPGPAPYPDTGELLEPVFELAVHPWEDGVAHPAVTATLMLLPTGAAWTTDGPIGPGWVRWDERAGPATVYADRERAVEGPGVLEFALDRERLTVAGSLRVEGGGSRWIMRYTGRVRAHRVEALRRRIARPSLRGAWTGTLEIELGDGERAALPAGGFVRLGSTVDEAVGLAADGSPVRLRRVRGDWTAAEHTALRFLAAEAEAAGRAGDAAALYAAAPDEFVTPGARVRGAYRTRDYPALIEALGRDPATELLESWRDMLATDPERIAALELAAPVYERLVSTLDDPREALVAAEQSRARAFADLLHRPARTPRVTPSTVDSVDRPFVTYFRDPGRITVWTGDGRGAVTRSTVDFPLVEPDVVAVRELLETEHPDRSTEAALTGLLERLGDLLWDPVDQRLLPDDPDELVLVVPHRELMLLPFPALRPGGRALVHRHALAVLPALTVLPREPMAVPRDVTALIDGRLRLTAECFPDVAAYYSRSTVHTRPSASLLGQPLPPGGVLYLGTHAVVGDDGTDGYIELADGPLRAADLSLDAGLVILAMCRSGHGVAGADGVVGLARAFLAAGPQALITALGTVREDAVLEIVLRLHEHWLGEGRTLAAAWRHAQAGLAGGYHHGWAPFVLFGRPA
ncbi:CHAT domain-containing protein [Dactylosporangium sp. CS-033363]|uniref:CHAT domain-containing protein n=1 Tax=Dactylosporangium sp. CS-033363 TaxID=3239935 RepID=UPI003D8B90E7